MNVEALWHDLECGAYTEDLALWRALAAEAGGTVLDVGAGTGRVTLALAAAGVPVVALDSEPALLAALAHRAAGLPVETVAGDARSFALGRRVGLILVPMQTLQLLGGPRGRAAFFARAREHLEPGGLLAAAVADALGCFDEEHPLPPPPETRDIVDVRYSTRLLGVAEQDGRAVLRRRREVIGPGEHRDAHELELALDRVTPDELVAEAVGLGFRAEPHRSVPETEEYLGSTVVMLRRG